MTLEQCARKMLPGNPFKSPGFEHPFVFDPDGYLRWNSLDGKLVNATRKMFMADYEIFCKHPVEKAVQSVNANGFAPHCSVCGLELIVAAYITKPPAIPAAPNVRSTP
jgi:hypothetical protein